VEWLPVWRFGPPLKPKLNTCAGMSIWRIHSSVNTRETITMAKRTVSKKAGTKGKGKLKKGYKYVKGGRIVKAKKAK
jgi:hypothetical protein